MNKKELLIGILLFLGSMLLLILLMEALLRITNPMAVDYRILARSAERVETLAPNYDGYFLGMPVLTNKFGHRIQPGRDYEKEKPAGTKRILLFGDSFAFGDEWPINESFIARLQDLLDPAFNKYQVLNFGVPGYAAYQEWKYIQESALDFEPDIILIEFTDHNDLTYFEPRNATASRSIFNMFSNELRSFLSHNSYAYIVMRDLYYKGKKAVIIQEIFGNFRTPDLHNAPEKNYTESEKTKFLGDLHQMMQSYITERENIVYNNEPSWQQTYGSLSNAAWFAKTNNISFGIILFPNTFDLACQSKACFGTNITYGELLGNNKKYYEFLERALHQLTPNVLSLHRSFSNHTLNELYDGTSHPGPNKNNLVAHAIQDELIAKSIVSSAN